MLNQRRLDTYIYIFLDFLAAFSAWSIFFVLLQGGFDEIGFWSEAVVKQFYLTAALIPTAWFLYYAIFDDYSDIYRLSRLATLRRTFFLSFTGVFFLFSTLVLDDFFASGKDYMSSFFQLFALHFLITATIRMFWLTRANRRLKNGKVFFNTIIIGGN